VNNRKVFLAASLAIVGIAGGLLLFRPETRTSAPPEAKTVATTAAPQTTTPDPQAAAPAMPVDAAQPGVVNAPATDAVSEYYPEQDGQIAFKADANGNLVTDEKARLDLERLHALYSPADREKKLQEAAATLPREAARRLHELMTQYQNYQAAMYQAYPPDRELTSAEQGVSQIDGMHALRVQHFGESATEGMFGAEERAQRELFKLMENEKDPGLTVEEKAERAQRIYQKQQGR
jgi:hypothetical protein